MGEKWNCRKATLSYPRHRFSPQDLLNFIESREFTAQWTALGLDDEDDLWHLQLCVMARPRGDEEIEGVGGLYRHRHFVQGRKDVKYVTVYYGYFEDYGVVYLSCVDERAEKLAFSPEERSAIKRKFDKIAAELDRWKTIRTSGKAAQGADHDKTV